jgi:YVTN family beta-propeller protein
VRLQIVALFVIIAGTVAAANYRILTRIPIGGSGGWDYLTADSAAHRLYVSHGTRVVVVDLDANKVVGEIPDTPGVHGIAVVPAQHRGYISDGGSNDVTIIDLATLKTIGKVQTGGNPDAIVYDEPSNCVFTFNGRSHDSTVIDASSGKVKTTIPLAGKPEFAVVDGRGRLWVNIEDKHEIAELDTVNARVLAHYPLRGCEDPSGLAFDPQRRRLFSACANKVMVVSDPQAQRVIATVPIGAGVDGVAFDAQRRLAFSSNGRDGTISVVEENDDTYRLAATVPTQVGARTITLDPRTHRLYLSTAEFQTARANASQRGCGTRVPDTFQVLVVGR